MTFFRREGENPMKHFGSYLTIAWAVPYVLCIHHVLYGNYTTPRYVDVRTRTRWNRELSQINWLSRTLKYCVYFRNSAGGSVRGGTRRIVYTAPSDSVRRGTRVIVYTAPKAEPNL